MNEFSIISYLLDHFEIIDFFVFAWFVLAWFLLSALIDSNKFRKNGVSHLTAKIRITWMQQMLKRGNRVVDTQIIATLSHGAAFFASTSILIIGGLTAALGNGADSFSLLQNIPLSRTSSLIAFEIKIVMLITLFFYSFVKFIWAFRLSNHCAILIGAAALPHEITSEDAQKIAKASARVSELAGNHLNKGFRSYFFSFALVGWLIGPIFFAATTTAIFYTLFRREFRSKQLQTLREIT